MVVQDIPDPDALDWAEKSLVAASKGDHDEAGELADRASDAGSLLGIALSTYLRTSHHQDVYDQPTAFEAFIAGGGNVDLYQRTSATLATGYPGIGSLLDIGCGNGLALVPALQQSVAAPGGTAPSMIDLVEPGADLLQHALAAIAGTGLPVTTTAWQVGLTDFLRSAPPGQRWQLAQSTFALQSIEPQERLAALTVLSTRVDRLLIVDFDVADEKPRSRAHISGLATRYERGLAEYDDDVRVLVAQGFLMPVLLGQLDPDGVRTNWEHTADQWREQAQEAGFRDVQVLPLADYWSAPAFVLGASGR
ncbi:hypothetical protein ABIB25_001899 [Nakamurella sp. UYEF19]|uniref:class I SAM-dependent methyltransferase n=1 Tax=Nakamurella sp. UYEF19 TaxID=1756392 RepID=UPI0033917719